MIIKKNMNNIKTEIIPNEIIKNIKHYRKPNYGSDTTCYILNKDCVIKLFNPNCNILEKLFLTQETYGNDTYLFVSTLVLNEQEKLIGYTMPYVKGSQLGPHNFENLTIQNLIDFLSLVELDTLKVANNHIYTYDNFLTNILITNNGFKCIDSIDFQIKKNIQSSLLYHKDLEIFLNNIWYYLLSPETKKLITKLNLKKNNLYDSPSTFFKTLYEMSLNVTDNNLTQVSDFKKLVKKKD